MARVSIRGWFVEVYVVIACVRVGPFTENAGVIALLLRGPVYSGLVAGPPTRKWYTLQVNNPPAIKRMSPTADVIAAVAEAVRRGAQPRYAIMQQGVVRREAENWLTQAAGLVPPTEYADLGAAIDKAEADWYAGNEIAVSSDPDWRSKARALEARDTGSWKREQSTTGTDPAVSQWLDMLVGKTPMPLPPPVIKVEPEERDAKDANYLERPEWQAGYAARAKTRIANRRNRPQRRGSTAKKRKRSD
jgi:hypothetical protein